ncbi:hypothetical protein J6590_070506 [Homalodisca vitripennis]|nr:hypothetical protein J6590_070506 [Homalodisca vitripennis]
MPQVVRSHHSERKQASLKTAPNLDDQNLKETSLTFALPVTCICICGELETSQHVLMECWFYEEERRDLKELLRRKMWAWEKINFLRSKVSALEFSRMCRRIGSKKHDLENAGRQQAA